MTEKGLLRGSAVCGTACAVEITGHKQARFVFREIKTDLKMLRAGDLTELFTVTCKVRNEGSFIATQQVPCTLDGVRVELDIASRPDESRWSCNQMRYGIIYGRNKAAGDFDAVVRVEYEEYTTPHAMHGIVVKNSLEKPWIDAGGLIYSGAMSSRGFFVKHYGTPD